jgi:adenine-specific DNA-methyltransferase
MQRLELTWIGKGQEPEVEPRILLHDPSKDYGDPDSENMLIHGDNLLALKALEQQYAGQVKCIYIDPPYNTGAAFEYYDDNLEHSIWLRLMRARLTILRNLLSMDGTIWIQIDDEEQAYLKVLCDEVFGRSNFINMISVNMKNIAGASGGGEDKRLKKNCEYILAYARDYSLLPLFNGPYSYTEMSELIQQYIDEGKSWKYTTVLLEPGEKEYYGSTVDGDGNEIKVYLRKNPVMMSIKQVARRDGITEKEAYKKYGVSVFRTTNAQSSIRTRIMDYRNEEGIQEDLISIEYVPRTGKNRGVMYEQFYKVDCKIKLNT